MTKIRAYLVLLRPPNLLTALADILAGFAASSSLYHVVGAGPFELVQHDLPWGSLTLTGFSSICLYAGGVILNDVFDARLDKLERPERPIPSGLVTRKQGAVFGAFWLATGVLLAFLSNNHSGLVALVIAGLVLLYDAFSKSHAVAGPLNMGLCRGANLLLGISVYPQFMMDLGFLTIIPIIYVAAITVASRGEVHGSNRLSLSLSIGLYLLTAFMIVSLSVLESFNFWHCAAFLAILLIMVIPPLLKAWHSKDPAMIGKAVKYGVLGLIILNATIAAGFAGWFFGLLLLILLAFSILLAKIFAVT